MRTSWSLSVAAVSVLLVTSLSAAIAQEEGPAPVAFVTGSVTKQVDHNEAEGWDEGAAAGPRFVRGYEVLYPATNGRGSLAEQDIEWSDPRLPAKHWISLDYHLIYKPPEGPEGAMSVVTSHLLEDEDGSWTGTGRAVEDDADRYGLYELTGHGDYEGLYALLRGSPGIDVHGPWDRSYEGYIFEGQLPKFPDLPEPVTSEGMQTYPFPVESDADRPSGSPAPSLDGAPPDVADPMTPAAFAFTLEPMGEPTWGTERDSEDGRALEERGTLEVQAMEAPDTRASGVLTSTRNRNQMEVAGGGVQTYAFRMRLANDGGEWSGTDHGLMAFAEGAFGAAAGVTVLTGEGGYEGLTLILSIPWSMPGEADTNTGWGVIVPSDLMPPMPDPIEPPAE